MKSNIQIKFLSLDEMENARNIDWRYEHVGLDNLGFADKLKNRVYVRAGLEPQLQTLLIDHELSHLFEMEGTDEDEHGIRHKKKGGFMRIFMPILGSILGSILLPGVGSALGLGLGGLGTAAATGIGAGLGGVVGSSATGKPNWLGNTIGGAAAGVGSGIGSMFGGGLPANAGITFGTGAERGLESAGSALGSGIGGAGGGAASSGMGQSIGGLAGSSLGSLFSGAFGQGQSAQGGSRPTSSGSSFRNPDFSQQSNANPTYSGWTDTIGLPGMPSYMGQAGSEAMTNSRGMGGLSKMPMNPGLGQAGIGNAGQDVSAGFNKPYGQGFSQMFNPMMDEQGFNQQNGGTLAF